MKSFKKFVEEKKIDEAVDQKVVIHTKNGKVSSIEQGTFMPNGVFIGNAGTSFDKGFIGMDPEEAKAALVKYSRFDPAKIIIEDVKPQNLKSHKMVPFEQLVRGDIIYDYNPHNGRVGDVEYMVLKTDGKWLDAVEYAGQGTMHISKEMFPLVPADK